VHLSDSAVVDSVPVDVGVVNIGQEHAVGKDVVLQPQSVQWSYLAIVEFSHVDLPECL